MLNSNLIKMMAIPLSVLMLIMPLFAQSRVTSDYIQGKIDGEQDAKG